jgi:hypothetical protein
LHERKEDHDMKIEQNKAFQPVTITLETEEEVALLQTGLRAGAIAGRGGNTQGLVSHQQAGAIDGLYRHVRLVTGVAA